MHSHSIQAQTPTSPICGIPAAARTETPELVLQAHDRLYCKVEHLNQRAQESERWDGITTSLMYIGWALAAGLVVLVWSTWH